MHSCGAAAEEKPRKSKKLQFFLPCWAWPSLTSLQRAPGLRLIWDTEHSVSLWLICSCFHWDVAAAGIGLKAVGWLRLWNGSETPFSCTYICAFQGEASRYIFLNKFRKFLQENASNRGVRTSPRRFNPQKSEYCRLRNDEESSLQTGLWLFALYTGHHYHPTKPLPVVQHFNLMWLWSYLSGNKFGNQSYWPPVFLNVSHHPNIQHDSIHKCHQSCPLWLYSFDTRVTMKSTKV